jgi:hypothetical protein
MFLELGMCTEWKVKNFLKSSAVFSLSGRSFVRWAQALVAVSSKWSPGFNTRVHVGLVMNKEVTYFSNHFILPLSGIIPMSFLTHSSLFQEEVNEPVRSRSSTQIV